MTLEIPARIITGIEPLSLFMTEIKGYNVDTYRRGMGFVDYLYNQRPDE